MSSLLTVDGRGLWCADGGFHVDPWAPVDLAVITHAHGDHARGGSARYLCAEPGVDLLRRRVGEAVDIEGVPYGEPRTIGTVTVSFHPAGHVLGSAQVRIHGQDETLVVSGDYKRAADPTCAPFEPVPCDTFLTEATFALPIYRWDPTEDVVAELLGWWEANRAAGRAAVVFCYALGKAQRLLAELARQTDREVLVHGAMEPLNDLYRDAGIPLLPTRRVADTERGKSLAGELILAPPSAAGSTWMRRFGDHETAFVSGWMRLRGTRRRRSVDRGFVLSDHADWHDLLRTIRETGARRVLTTHGYTEPLARHLADRGWEAVPLATYYEGEAEE